MSGQDNNLICAICGKLDGNCNHDTPEEEQPSGEASQSCSCGDQCICGPTGHCGSIRCPIPRDAASGETSGASSDTPQASNPCPYCEAIQCNLCTGDSLCRMCETSRYLRTAHVPSPLRRAPLQRVHLSAEDFRMLDDRVSSAMQNAANDCIAYAQGKLKDLESDSCESGDDCEDSINHCPNKEQVDGAKTSTGECSEEKSMDAAEAKDSGECSGLDKSKEQEESEEPKESMDFKESE